MNVASSSFTPTRNPHIYAEHGCRDMAKRKVPFLLGNLPEDPECSDLLEVRPVQEGDFREGLTPGVDVTVHAKAAMPAGTVLGLYRNITVTKAEERTIQENPPQQFQGTTSEWHQKLDAYTADIEQPKPSYKTSKKRFQGIYEDSLKVRYCTALLQHLVCNSVHSW